MSFDEHRGIRPWEVVLVVVVVAILAVGYFAGTALYQDARGPSQATAADCRVGQELVDSAQTWFKSEEMKTKAGRKATYDAYRQKWETISDGYLQVNISSYMEMSYRAAAGKPESWPLADFAANLEKANSHCKRYPQLVMPAIPGVGV